MVFRHFDFRLQPELSLAIRTNHMDMHAGFFPGEEVETVLFPFEYCRTHVRRVSAWGVAINLIPIEPTPRMTAGRTERQHLCVAALVPGAFFGRDVQGTFVLLHAFLGVVVDDEVLVEIGDLEDLPDVLAERAEA